ncbi:MAG TPA: aspartate carbamoyltransferase catalytic subunit [Chloroflexota bacterium]|jgi:aspartate carbamoyltransferase catalytic subunit|nr:aspartate carbamoyltransferase catalytic subunit [Chloroflexota bacterium]
MRRKDVLDLDDFSVGELQEVLETAEAMREVLSRPIKRVPSLRGKTIVNCFYEASTRTRVSFELAGKNLSADVVNITASGSSVEKGESLIDTTRTLQALGADMVIMRHPHAGAPYLVARELNAGVVNAGDGWHAHPTQALLDLYTVRERLGSIEGRKVVIVGDVLHSRVARSDIWGFTTLGAEVVLCAPPTLIPPGIEAAIADGLRSKGLRGSGADKEDAPVRVTYDLDRACEDADVLMALRIQKERQDAGLFPSLREYSRLYGLTRERVARAKFGALVMHPGPMNEGVEITPEVAYGPQSVIEEQVTNGVAVRMALLYLLAGGHSGRTV